MFVLAFVTCLLLASIVTVTLLNGPAIHYNVQFMIIGGKQVRLRFETNLFLLKLQLCLLKWPPVVGFFDAFWSIEISLRVKHIVQCFFNLLILICLVHKCYACRSYVSLSLIFLAIFILMMTWSVCYIHVKKNCV